MKYRDLTADELEAVKAFAAEFGRNWKSRLSFDYWPSARIYIDRAGHEYPELHRLRNQLGPQWLARFRLPGEYA
jgi:hypothetical protein